MSNSTVLGRTLLVEPGAGASSVLAGSLSSKMALLPASDAAIFSEFELLAGDEETEDRRLRETHAGHRVP